MDSLREALNFISNFVPQPSTSGQVIYPRLNPGLEREEIEQQVSVLSFKVAEEVYELYQWSNGAFLGNLPYPEKNYSGNDYEKIHSILSLEWALDIARSWGNGSFPLFVEESEYLCFTIGAQEQQRTAPIFCSDESFHPKLARFESLTDMMLRLVAAVNYQANARKNMYE